MTAHTSAARSVWLAAAITGAVVLIVVAVQVFRPRDFYTGTNNAGSSGPVATLASGQRLCLDTLLPAGTGRIEIRGVSGPGPAPTFQADVRTPSGTLATRAIATAHGGEAHVDFPIHRRPDAPAAVPAHLCVVPARGSLQVFGRPGTQPAQPVPTLNGAPLPVRVAVWYLPPAGERSSLASEFGKVVDRAALFRPGVVGPWTYVVLLLVLLPATALLGIWLLARAAAGDTPRSAALMIALIAFLTAAAWALVEPAFNAPDESDHFAYVQSVAERGRSPDTRPGRRPAYSSEEIVAVDGAQLAGQYGQRDGRPPWLAANERQWERLRRQLHASADDGGGASTVAPYSSLYYALVAPAYLAASGQSIWSQLTLLRLASALLGALAAACVFLLVRELVPRHPWAAVGAGLLVALQPMFSFVSGVVNNDAAINAAAALLLLLLVRAVRRGLTVGRAASIGVVIAILPFAKGSGFFLYPAAAVALAAIIWSARRERRLHALVRPLAVMAVGFVLAAGVCGALAATLHHDALPTRSGSFAAAPATGRDQFPPVPGLAGNSPTRAIDHPGAFLSYTWQLFLPRLPFMSDLKPAGQSFPAFQIYVERAWASFGLVTIQFARWAYALILAAMIAAGALALWAWRRAPGAVRDRGIELIVLAVAVLGVVLGVEAVYFREAGGGGSPSEQGRYLLPVIAAFAVIAVGASFAFRRRAASVMTVAVVAMIGVQYSALVLALTAFYM